MRNYDINDTIIYLGILAIFVLCMVIGIDGYCFTGNHTLPSSHTGFINGSKFDYVSFNFTSDEFGMQNDIQVSIIAYLDTDFVSKHPNAQTVTKLYVYLPNSTPKPMVFENGHYLSHVIELDKQQDGSFRNSPTTIQYVTSGDMCYFASADPNLSPTSDCLPNAQPVIHIGSLEDVNQEQSNKNIQFLTWVILGFTVLIVGDPIINIKNHFSKYFEKPNENETNSESELKGKSKNRKQR